MDLLRQILIRLSLDRIRTTILDDDFREVILAQRLMHYTGMSRERIAEYARAIYWVPERSRYAALTSINGEISRADKRYLPKRMLDARAIFLRDMSWSIRNESFSEPIVMNLALISREKSLQDRAIPNTTDSASIFDPELISWTPVISRQYQSLAEFKSELVTNNVIQTIGYLHPKKQIWSADSKSVYYLRGYFLRSMSSKSDQFASDPELDAMLRASGLSEEHITGICLFSGYFPDWVMSILSVRLNRALTFIRPELLSRFPKQSLTFDPLPFVINNLEATESTIKRARKMLLLIDIMYPELTDYRLCLRILTGESVSLADVQRIDQADYLMNVVSHPQSPKLAEPVRIGSINYDLTRRVELYGTTDPKAVILAYATHGLMRVKPEKLTELGEILSKIA